MNPELSVILFAGAVWSVAFPAKRAWPPPQRRSWQYLLTWACFDAVIVSNAALIFLDWNSWVFPSPLRFIVGVPLALLGGMLAVWGMLTVGWKNTSGQRGGFVDSGPYRFTRNPQYLGDIVFFILSHSDMRASRVLPRKRRSGSSPPSAPHFGDLRRGIP